MLFQQTNQWRHIKGCRTKMCIWSHCWHPKFGFPHTKKKNLHAISSLIYSNSILIWSTCDWTFQRSFFMLTSHMLGQWLYDCTTHSQSGFLLVVQAGFKLIWSQIYKAHASPSIESCRGYSNVLLLGSLIARNSVLKLALTVAEGSVSRTQKSCQ